MKEDFIELAQEIRELLGKDKVSDALELLKAQLQDHAALQDTILQAARHESLRKQIDRGIMDQELVGIEENKIRMALLDLVWDLDKEGKAQTQVFISHSSEPYAKNLAKHIHDQLEGKGFSAFLDFEDLRGGDEWAKVILGALKASDYFVLLLSEAANSSEMVLKEIAEARRMKDQMGKPRILPIWVKWPKDIELNFKLTGWLQQIQHLNWESEKDTQAITNEILNIVSKRTRIAQVEEVSEDEVQRFVGERLVAPTPVAPLEVPRGAVRLDSKFYIERAHEAQFIRRIEEPGALLRIRGPRQFGKTSLLGIPPTDYRFISPGSQ